MNNQFFYARGKEISLDKTSIMGILNVTPDSFSDGGLHADFPSAYQCALDMISQGAHVIDIGGESTRPGYTEVSSQEEINRIKPVIASISKECNIVTSVDTYKYDVAKEALEAGADIINDITGLKNDSRIAELVKEYDAGIILMFNMRTNGSEDGKIIDRAVRELEESVEIALKAGIPENHIMTDPGIGFGTTREQDLELTRELSKISLGKYPVLYACSRKRITKEFCPEDSLACDRDSATIGLSLAAINNGANMLRVHNVKDAFMAVKAFDSVYRG